ncbi:MAG TPA: hypothetical protein VK468_01815, partial [Pyrinomonadaceae bacterium]|nr:hypothetical protein [Pyrinomonadaceae bacterium]
GITIFCYLPWRSADKYYHYLGMQPGVMELAQQNNFGRSLVIVRGDEHPDYQSAWIYNPLDFTGDVPLFATVKNPDVFARLMTAYADRPVWVIDGPTRAGGRYAVVSGPASAAELLKVDASQFY